MTLLDREIVDAVSIVALTTVVLAARHRGEHRNRERHRQMTGVPGRGGRPRSRLAAVSALALVALVAAAGVIALFAPHRVGAAASSHAAMLSGAMLPGELTGSAPWPANAGRLRARLRALGLPALGREGTALHIHQHLDVFVRGRRVAVPAGIGIAASAGFISPLHTHDASGVVHVESPDVRTFTLGQLFGVWGVRFTKRCLGGYCAHGGERLWVFSDGHLFTGDPRVLPLAPQAEIVVAFGTRGELPEPLPSGYAFPAGL